jgi:hypothetical protein
MNLDTTNLRLLAADLRELVDLHTGAYATVNHAADALDRLAELEQPKAEPAGREGGGEARHDEPQSRANAATGVVPNMENSAVGSPITEPIGKLPPLPEPEHWYFDGGEALPTGGYTDDQMHAYARLHAAQFVRDAERFDWYFGPDSVKCTDFMTQYFKGMKERWTPDQWRAAIDAALAKREVL